MKDFLENKGYKRKGKIYTPPILQLGNFDGVHWIEELIPELFWIGILQKKYGFGNGSNLVSSIVNAALDISENKSIWFAPISSFNHFTVIQKAAIKHELIEMNILSKVQHGLNAICFLYPELPLNFLIDDSSINYEGEELTGFKAYLNEVFDRTSNSANLVQGVALDMIFRSNIEFKIDPRVALADFPKFVEYPTTEISKRVASSIRSTINLIYSNKAINRIDAKWHSYFWNRGLQIDKCV